jgi:DNA/RNA-binding domain of Phe-tRNA-synthetase-like protein
LGPTDQSRFRIHEEHLMTLLGFQYHSEILARFPLICGGVILLHGISNSPTSPDLLQEYLSEQRLVIEKIGQKPLSELPSLAGWRAAFRSFGVDPTKYRSAAESLLRRLTKKGDIPSISTLVDLCNLVSIRHALPVAAVDSRSLNGPITVHFASGGESFTAHDTPEPERPDPGEVIFSDDAGLVVARRWCWKQSVESTVEMDTHDAILTIESQHQGGEADVRLAIQDLAGYLNEATQASIKTGILTAGNPSFVENF